MKLDQTEQQVAEGGIITKKRFKVMNSAAMMQMLSKGVYSDIIRAPIRELCTNAIDSHKAAGNADRPISVHLPTSSEPYFVVRDYGVGLSEKDMLDMYRTYGASNKTHTNDLQGCLGLGSKSPFAYTNSFTATSYFNGKKYVFINSKNTHNCPEIALVATENTNLPNGLEVRFAVKENDRDAFYDKLAEVAVPFPVRPATNIPINYENYEHTYIFSGKNWKVFEKTYYGQSSLAVMGYIEYPIDPNKIGEQHRQEYDDDLTPSWYKDRMEEEKYDCKRTLENYRTLLNYGIELQFEIGDLDFDIGREALQYTQHTVNSILKRLDEVIDEHTSIINNDIEKAATLWDARCKLTELSKLHFLNKCAQGSTYYWEDPDTGDKHRVKTEVRFNDFLDDIDFVQLAKHYYSTFARYYSPRSCVAESRVHFILNDTKNAGVMAAERMMEEKGLEEAYVLSHLPKDKKPTTIAEIREFLDETGYPKEKVLLASEAPSPPKRQKSKTTRAAVVGNGYKFTGNTNRLKDSWHRTEIDLTEGGVYVIHKGGYWAFDLQSYNSSYASSNHGPWNLRNYVVHIKNLLKYGPKHNLEKDFTIYGVSPTLAAKLEDKSNWLGLTEFVQQTIDTLFSQPTKIVTIDYLSYNKRYLYDWVNEINGELPSAHMIKQAVKNVDHTAYAGAVEFFSSQMPDHVSITGTDDIEDELETIIQSYPLLENIGLGSSTIKNEEWVRYVTLVDKESEEQKQVQKGE